MIRSIDIQGWDGIELGGAADLERTTLLVCPDEASVRATLSALWLLRVEEVYAGMFEELWHPASFDPHRRMPAGWSPRSLLPSGSAHIGADLDGRRTSLHLSLSSQGTLVGKLDVAPFSIEIGLNPKTRRIEGLRGVPSGPRTMARRLCVAQISPDLLAVASKLVASSSSQLILVTSDPDPSKPLAQLRSQSVEATVAQLIVQGSAAAPSS